MLRLLPPHIHHPDLFVLLPVTSHRGGRDGSLAPSPDRGVTRPSCDFAHGPAIDPSKRRTDDFPAARSAAGQRGALS